MTSKEEGLKKELDAAGNLLDAVTEELKTKRLSPTVELQKDLGLLENALADMDEGATDRLINPVDPDARMGTKTNKRARLQGTHRPGRRDRYHYREETTPANKPDGASSDLC